MPSILTDKNYLKNDQYRTSSNLDARVALHVRFSTNSYGWMPWVFDHLDLSPSSRLLELGCGQGDLWKINLSRLPGGARLVLIDYSPGMLTQARFKLDPRRDSSSQFFFGNVDAHRLPFPDGTFTHLVANHMLYHLQDLPTALSEIRRVLTSGGYFFAATNGDRHMSEMYDLIDRFSPDSMVERVKMSFSMENGAELLRPYFDQVQQDAYPDSLDVTEAEPLVAYILSMMSLKGMPELQQHPAELRQFIQGELEKTGVIHISKAGGIFIARKI